MDQLSAHLDRGWDLAQKGDAAGASACAKRALEIDAQSPEVHNLLGYTSALTGDSEEALEHYRQAIALDETYLEAMLNAAAWTYVASFASSAATLLYYITLVGGMSGGDRRR